jgi:hypothetical protein
MPDTTGVYHAAYIAAAGIYIAYVASLWTRGRRVRERMAAARDEANRAAAESLPHGGVNRPVTTPRTPE